MENTLHLEFWPAIRSIHLELTTKCNASCPQCPRNMDGGAVQPNLALVELDIKDIKKIVQAKDFPELREFQLCGAYGDPIIAKDCLAICEHMRATFPEIEIRLHTNGSARAPSWWSRLSKTRAIVIFGIDGLEDTNRLYRRGTQWRKLMQNANAFIQAGGQAEWAFVVFEHNQHQIHSAADLAAKMGFNKFYIKKTTRFFHDQRLLDKTPVRNSSGEIEYYLRPSTLPNMANPAIGRLVSKLSGRLSNFYDTTPIACKALKRQGIYISASAYVFPCAWLGAVFSKPSSESIQVDKMILANGGYDAISALQRPIPEIVNGKFFKAIEESWRKPTVTGGRLQRCARTCGECDVSGAQQESASTKD